MSDVELMSEAQLQETVIELARYRDWLWYHTRDSRRSNAGFPDLVLVRGGHLVFVELKSQKGRVSPNQLEWLNLLGDVADQYVDGGNAPERSPVGVYLWRPADLRNGTIAKVLR